MARTPRRRAESDIYHVVARGVGRQIIFEDDADRRRFLALLKERLADTEGALLAWCLMDNHFHLLLRMPLEELSKTMRSLQTAFALFFNRRHDRGTFSRTASRASRSRTRPTCSPSSATYTATPSRRVSPKPASSGGAATTPTSGSPTSPRQLTASSCSRFSGLSRTSSSSISRRTKARRATASSAASTPTTPHGPRKTSRHWSRRARPWERCARKRSRRCPERSETRPSGGCAGRASQSGRSSGSQASPAESSPA